MKQPSLGMHIAKMRMQKKMTQKELADAINVDIRTIQRIESGNVTPRMYTIKLLSDTLGSGIPVEPGNPQSDLQGFRIQLKWAFILGVIFSANYIPLIFNNIFHYLNPLLNQLLGLVQLITIIFTVRGFYLIGRLNNNTILTITSGLAIVLLPLLTISSMFNTNFINPSSVYLLFNLACINAIGQGIGFFMIGQHGKNNYKNNLYKIAGVIAVLQSILLLSTKFEILVTALTISCISNFLGLYILYTEYKEPGNTVEKSAAYPALA